MGGACGCDGWLLRALIDSTRTQRKCHEHHYLIESIAEEDLNIVNEYPSVFHTHCVLICSCVGGRTVIRNPDDIGVHTYIRMRNVTQ